MNDSTPTPQDRLTVSTDQVDGTMVFVLAGDLDPHTSPYLQDQINTLASDDGAAVVLDVEAVGFADSAGLRVFADTHRRLHGGGGSLTVRNPSAGLRKLLDITGLDDHLIVEP